MRRSPLLPLIGKDVVRIIAEMTLQYWSVMEDASLVWEYMLCHHKLSPECADVILCLGSNDTRVAVHAAELWKRKVAPLVVFSGNVGVLTRDLFAGEPEADVFARVAEQHGLPREAMLLERKSTNTGENIQFCRELLKDRFPVKKVVVVQKPFMERRSLATFEKQWPKPVVVCVSSPKISFFDYPNPPVMSFESVVSVMVGDLQRIMEYPALGFMTKHSVPKFVEKAFRRLVGAGFTSHLLHPL